MIYYKSVLVVPDDSSRPHNRCVTTLLLQGHGVEHQYTLLYLYNVI